MNNIREYLRIGLQALGFSRWDCDDVWRHPVSGEVVFLAPDLHAAFIVTKDGLLFFNETTVSMAVCQLGQYMSEGGFEPESMHDAALYLNQCILSMARQGIKPSETNWSES